VQKPKVLVESTRMPDIATLEDAFKAVKQAIADLKAMNIPVPIALHQAAHALSYAVAADRSNR
jgi:hypothetical protein